MANDGMGPPSPGLASGGAVEPDRLAEHAAHFTRNRGRSQPPRGSGRLREQRALRRQVHAQPARHAVDAEAARLQWLAVEVEGLRASQALQLHPWYARALRAAFHRGTLPL